MKRLTTLTPQYHSTSLILLPGLHTAGQMGQENEDSREHDRKKENSFCREIDEATM